MKGGSSVYPTLRLLIFSLVFIGRLDPERTVLSGLRLDTSRADLWFIFGVLVQHKALKQHAFIQALRLDAYHSSTWAHLGQVFTSSHNTLNSFIVPFRMFYGEPFGVVAWS